MLKKTSSIQTHPSPKPQDTPLQPLLRTYGGESQCPNPLDKSPAINTKDQKCVQQVFGSFIYYGISVNPLILYALSDIASQQSTLTENTMKKVSKFRSHLLIT